MLSHVGWDCGVWWPINAHSVADDAAWQVHLSRPPSRGTFDHHWIVPFTYSPLSVKLLGVCRMLLVDSEPISRGKTLVLVSYVENGLTNIAALNPDSIFKTDPLPKRRE